MDECCYEGNISFEWEISRLLSWLTGSGKPVCRADIVLIPKWIAFLKGILESFPGALTYSGYDLSESSPFALPAGHVEVKLPGKEGTALLAYRCERNQQL